MKLYVSGRLIGTDLTETDASCCVISARAPPRSECRPMQIHEADSGVRAHPITRGTK